MAEKNTPIIQIAENVYRWKETAKLSLRLSYTMTDLLREIARFCNQNHIEISDGIDNLLGDAESLLARIKEIQHLPIPELLRLPQAELSPEVGHPDKYTEDGTMP